MNKLFKKFYKKLKIFHNIHIKHKFLFKKKSYSMEGEDLIILDNLKDINCGIYIDAGCYHPTHLNNTKFNCFDIWQKIETNYSRPFLAVQNVRNIKRSSGKKNAR